MTPINGFITFGLGGLVGSILVLACFLFRRVLPKNHFLQAFVSEEAVTKTSDWLVKTILYIFVFGLMFTFIALTFIYS